MYTLLAIFQSKPGFASCLFDFPSAFIPGQCIFFGQAQFLHILVTDIHLTQYHQSSEDICALFCLQTAFDPVGIIH